MMQPSDITHLGPESLVFGTAGLTAMHSYRAALALLAEAEASGIRHFDTAPLYGKGYAEWILGRYLARSGSRALVTSKFGLGRCPKPRLHPLLALPLNHLRKAGRRSGSGPGIETPAIPRLPYRRITVGQVSGSLQESLDRLGRKRIDVYLLHEGLPSFLDADALDFLRRKQSEGVVGMLGVGTDAGVLAAATGEDFSPFDVLQYAAGPHVAALRERHPGKLHFLHGCFRNQVGSPGTGSGLSSPLGYWAERNPGGKLLFFSSRLSAIRENAGSHGTLSH